MGKIYKILTVSASNIDGLLNVDISKKNSSFFKSTMQKNIDLSEVLEKAEQDSIKVIYNDDIFNVFAKVSFYDKYKYYLADQGENIYMAIGHYKNEIRNPDYDPSDDNSKKYLDDDDCIYRDSNNKVIGFIGKKVVNNPLKNADELGITFKNKQYKPKLIASKKDLRKKFYQEGFVAAYFDGEKEIETIKYVRYKRSAAMAKKGDCLFIREDFYDYMMKWTKLYDEKQLERIDPENDPRITNQLTSWEAYIALSLSDLDDTIDIPLHNILFVRDLDSNFTEECIVVKKVDGKLKADKERVDIKNTIWDGEGLLDESMFTGKYRDKSMLLLRNRFFKSCVFKTRLQQWFKDNRIENVDQLNGYTLATRIEDVKLVVTESSVKLLKFADKEEEILIRKKSQMIAENEYFAKHAGSTYAFITSDPKTGKSPTTEEEVKKYIQGYWAAYGDSRFGVVKYDKKTKFFDGKMVRTNYQLLNTLPLSYDDVKNLYSDAIEYYNNVADHVSCLSYHTGILSNNLDYYDDDEAENFNTYKFDLLKEMLSISDSIRNTKLFSKYRSDALKALRENMGDSKILVEGTYATLFSNGYELLQYIIDKGIYGTRDFRNQPLKNGQIMCKHFKNDEKLLCERNPNITMGNLYSVTNKISNEINKYFDLSDEIVCVNSIEENLMQRLNGADFDSDTMLITNNKILVDALNKTYTRFPVPYNGLDSMEVEKKPLWEIDEDICNNQIGNIVNLSQELNSRYWDIYNYSDIDPRLEELYKQICKLAIMSNVEIDKAKRNYNVDIDKEMSSIKAYIKSNFNEQGTKPAFMDGKFNLRKANILYFKTPCDFVRKHLQAELKEKDNRGPKAIKMVEYLKDGGKTEKELDDNLKASIDEIVKCLADVKKEFTNKKPKEGEKTNQDNRELLDAFYDRIESDLNAVFKADAIYNLFKDLEDKLQKSDLSKNTKRNDPIEIEYLLYFIHKAGKLKDILKDDYVTTLKKNNNGSIKLYIEKFDEVKTKVN